MRGRLPPVRDEYPPRCDEPRRGAESPWIAVLLLAATFAPWVFMLVQE